MAKGEWKRTTQLIEAAVAVLEEQHPMDCERVLNRSSTLTCGTAR